jgi:translocation and assembly module TamB
LAAKVNQSNAQLNGTFNSDRGIGILQGTANWQGARPHINLKLRGNHLRVRQTPLVDALVNVRGLDNNPNLEVDIFPNQQEIQLKGKVDVVEANISMPKASMPVVGLSPDVRVIQYGQEQINTLKNALNWNINARVDVTVGATNGKANDRVKFIGFDSQIPLAGRLQLTQKGRNIAMHAYGAIGVTHAVTIEAFGQRLDLNRAIARFNGPLSAPSLDIDANKDVQGSTVGVRVLGTATSPNIQVYNDAGMSEQEALNALLTGRVNEGSSGLSNTDGFKSDVNNSIAAAGISLGLGGTRAFTNQLGRTFGLSGLALDAQGTGDDTQLSVTGYITPDLYLRYGVGIFTPVNKLTLRYQVNRRLYLEASQSLEKAIDIFYNWRF